MDKYQHFNPTFNPEVEAWIKYMAEHGDAPLKNATGMWVRPSQIIFELTHKKSWGTTTNTEFSSSQGGKF